MSGHNFSHLTSPNSEHLPFEIDYYDDKPYRDGLPRSCRGEVGHKAGA